MKDTDNPHQLMLDFETRRDELKDAVDSFATAAERLAGTDSPETAARVGEGAGAVRASVNRMVRILADQCGLPFHTVWVLAYHDLYKRTGHHAVVEGAREGDRRHLDAVQRKGLLVDLQETVAAMLTDGRFAPGGGRD